MTWHLGDTQPMRTGATADAINLSICAGVAAARYPRHSTPKLVPVSFVIHHVFLRLRPVKPFWPARLQKEHQQPVRIAGDPANNITFEKAILPDALDRPPERFHLQPVRRLLQSVRPGRGKYRVTVTAFIDT